MTKITFHLRVAALTFFILAIPAHATVLESSPWTVGLSGLIGNSYQFTGATNSYERLGFGGALFSLRREITGARFGLSGLAGLGAMPTPYSSTQVFAEFDYRPALLDFFDSRWSWGFLAGLGSLTDPRKGKDELLRAYGGLLSELKLSPQVAVNSTFRTSSSYFMLSFGTSVRF